jgi:hypothetical protein
MEKNEQVKTSADQVRQEDDIDAPQREIWRMIWVFCKTKGYTQPLTQNDKEERDKLFGRIL